MKKVLVIGAAGFVGKHLSKGLLAAGHSVRCLARKPERIQDLGAAGGEVVSGDYCDAASMQQATAGMQVVYVCTHSITPQPKGKSDAFMDLEMEGLRNIVDACKAHGVKRLVYITFLGISPDGPSDWARGRWQAEQFLVTSGLDATVLRPAQIVGIGGAGFNMMTAQAKRRVIPVMGSGQQKMRNIAVSDLVYYLIGVMDEPRSFGKCFDVGCDDVLTSDQMIDVAADVLGRPHPKKLHISPAVLRALAPLLERAAKMPKGAVRAFADGMDTDMVGDPAPIRAILDKPPMSYRQAVESALREG